MKLCQVVGRITLSIADPALVGGRLLLVSPLSRDQLAGRAPRLPLAVGNSFVTYDDLGASLGDTVGIVEGAEATSPFSFDIPLDAYNAAICDQVGYTPPPPRT